MRAEGRPQNVRLEDEGTDESRVEEGVGALEATQRQEEEGERRFVARVTKKQRAK